MTKKENTNGKKVSIPRKNLSKKSSPSLPQDPGAETNKETEEKEFNMGKLTYEDYGTRYTGMLDMFRKRSNEVNFINQTEMFTFNKYKGLISVLNDINLIKNSPEELKLQNEIIELKSRVIELTNSEAQAKELGEKIASLRAKERVINILPRIMDIAQNKLLISEEFKLLFQNSRRYESVVLSIDIRKSTELMLKAKSPEKFAEFITGLSEKLSEIIKYNYGIFDKFTGDGILAYFPSFYSGEFSILHALNAAKLCHMAFKEHYHGSRHCFNVIMNDIGLGIGIDYGSVTLVNKNYELTVVGIPVVYACRLSGAKVGTTLLNQPAFERIEEIASPHFKALETQIEIKNEGIAIAYIVEINERAIQPVPPNWDELIVKFKNVD